MYGDMLIHVKSLRFALRQAGIILRDDATPVRLLLFRPPSCRHLSAATRRRRRCTTSFRLTLERQLERDHRRNHHHGEVPARRGRATSISISRRCRWRTGMTVQSVRRGGPIDVPGPASDNIPFTHANNRLHLILPPQIKAGRNSRSPSAIAARRLPACASATTCTASARSSARTGRTWFATGCR